MARQFLFKTPEREKSVKWYENEIADWNLERDLEWKGMQALNSIGTTDGDTWNHHGMEWNRMPYPIFICRRGV